MFIETIVPRIPETDALGHINNNVLSVWFDVARVPIYRFFTPDLIGDKWKLIIARTEIDFIRQIFLDGDVEIRSLVSRIGNSSFDVSQTAFQNEKVCAKCKATWLHFDFDNQKSAAIPDDIRQKLKENMQASKDSQ